MQKFRIIARPAQQDCVKVFAGEAVAHDWICKVLLIYQVTSSSHGAHTLALVHWFDWVRFDPVLKCDAYRLMGNAHVGVISVASIARKVAMMPVKGGLYMRNFWHDKFLCESR